MTPEQQLTTAMAEARELIDVIGDQCGAALHDCSLGRLGRIDAARARLDDVLNTARRVALARYENEHADGEDTVAHRRASHAPRALVARR